MVVVPFEVDNKVLLLVPPGVGDNVPLLSTSSNGVGVNDEPTSEDTLGVGARVPFPIISV